MKNALLLVIFLMHTMCGMCKIVGYPTVYSSCSKEDFKTYYDKLPDTLLTTYWKTLYLLDDNTFGQMEYSISFCDSIVEGKVYKKLFIGDRDTLLYRQEEDKVYMYNDGHEALLLDYGLEEGDTFESAWGEKFVVTERIPCEPFHKYYYGNWRKCIALYYKDCTPKILHLRSLDDESREDEWMEGIGSVEWGIIPMHIWQKLNLFPQKPVRTHLIHGSTYKMYSRFEVVEANYAMIPFEPLPVDDTVSYSFSGDTLCIKDMCPLASGLCSAECTTNNNIVNLEVYTTVRTTNKVNRSFMLKIPGFKPGVYDIYMNGKLRREALVCGDTDGIGKMRDEENSDILYDLSGRRTAHPVRGVYIREGRKVVR